MIQLTGRRFVVTGGSRGIGAACCRLFAGDEFALYADNIGRQSKAGGGNDGKAFRWPAVGLLTIVFAGKVPEEVKGLAGQ